MNVAGIMRDDTERARAYLNNLANKGQPDDINTVNQSRNNGDLTPEQSVEPAQLYQNTFGSSERVSINDLLQRTGVKPEDFQAVCNEHPEIIQNIGGGPTCARLAASSDNVRSRYVNGKVVTGSCLRGVDNIYAQCRNDSLSCREAQIAKQNYKRSYQSANGGTCGYAALEGSGNYISVAIRNEAYGTTSRNSPEYARMNNLFRGVQPGVTVTIDSIDDTNMRKRLGDTAGGKYGHIAVKRNDGNFACDFVQKDFNFCRYGEYAHACFPKDAAVPREYAEMVIAQAQIRQANGNVIQNQPLSNETQSKKYVQNTPVRRNVRTY